MGVVVTIVPRSIPFHAAGMVMDPDDGRRRSIIPQERDMIYGDSINKAVSPSTIDWTQKAKQMTMTEVSSAWYGTLLSSMTFG